MESIYAFKKEFYVIQYDLDSWTINFIQGQCTPFDHRHYVSEVWARSDQGERRYGPDKDFSYKSVMTFSFDVETLFKITAHPLPTSTLWVKNMYI